MCPTSIFLLALVVIFLSLFFLSRYGYVKVDSRNCLADKTAIVTGGSTGLGYEIVIKLAARRCRVIVISNNVEEKIRKSIIAETDNPNIVFEHVKFESFKSIREVVDKIKKSENKIDILINNAGIGKCGNTLTEDGLNLTMQVNHYAPFLLTHLLIELLKKSEDGRIIFTSSINSFLHIITREMVTPTKIKNLSPILRGFDYANSKLCNVIVSDIFAEKLKKWNIKCNAYHPGIAKTAIFDQARENMERFNPVDVLMYINVTILKFFFSVEPELACQAAVQLAISNQLKNATGLFYGKFFPRLKPKACYDKVLCDKIWKASEFAVKLRPEEKLE